MLRSKKAVSPIIEVLFLMAIIFGAIAFSLTIIYPDLQTMNEQLDLEGNGSNILILDQSLRSLMLSGQAGTVYQSMDIGDGSAIYGDQQSLTQITMFYLDYAGTNTPLSGPTPIGATFNENQTRFIIRQNIYSNFFAHNSYTYLSGSADTQNMFYLNSTTKSSAPWPILNQSRFNDNYVFSALSYRNIISTERTLDAFSSTINVTIEIQRVQFQFKNNVIFNGDAQQTIRADYQGISVITSPWVNVPNAGQNDRVFYLRTDTTLWNVTSITSPQSNTEIPFAQDVPTNGALNVRIQFIDHIIEFDLS